MPFWFGLHCLACTFAVTSRLGSRAAFGHYRLGAAINQDIVASEHFSLRGSFAGAHTAYLPPSALPPSALRASPYQPGCYTRINTAPPRATAIARTTAAFSPHSRALRLRLLHARLPIAVHTLRASYTAHHAPHRLRAYASAFRAAFSPYKRTRVLPALPYAHNGLTRHVRCALARLPISAQRGTAAQAGDASNTVRRASARHTISCIRAAPPPQISPLRHAAGALYAP